jgi:hypothetical protein
VLGDEGEPVRPEMTLVGAPLPPAGGAERLTRAGAGPDLPAGGPAGEAEGERPAADAGEEVALAGRDGPGVEEADVCAANHSAGEMAGGNEALEPSAGVRVIVGAPGHYLVLPFLLLAFCLLTVA